MYATPLRKCQRGQWLLDANLDEYNQVVELDEAHSLVPGDEVIIRDDDTGTEELHVVNQLVDQSSFTTLDPIITTFIGDEIRVFRIGYPAPINQISARYAAGFIYDKYFAAQAAPNVSDYGDKMRSVAMGQLNDILNGRATLECQQRIGDLFGNPWIDSRYALRQLPQEFQAGERDMSKI